MKVLNIRTIPGPNVYSHQPVLVMKLDLEDLAGRESYEVPGFVDRLLALLPGCYEHYCGLGHPGGFVERLRGGTYFGHVVEHVAIELQAAAGCDATYGQTRATRTPGVYRMVVEYCNEACARHCLAAAKELVEAALRGESFPVAETIAEAKRL